MFSGKGYSFANQVLDFNVGGVVYTPPSVHYLALFLSPILAGGLGGAEVSFAGTGYARKAIPNTLSEWSAANNGVKYNLNEIVFPPTSLSWGLIVAAALTDAPTGGNILYYGPLEQAVSVNQVGVSVQFLAGQIQIKEL